MLLAMESYHAWRTLGTQEAVRVIKEAGFDGVDWSFYWEAEEEFCQEDYREKANRLKEALQKYELRCNQAHAPFANLRETSQKEFEELNVMIRRSIEAAGIIGADHIVIHGLPVMEGMSPEQNIEANYTYYKSFEPLAIENGVKIAVENLRGCFTRPELLNTMMKKLNSPWFIGLVDIGHAWVRAGMQPGAFLRELNPGVCQGLHIHDNHGQELGLDEHLLPYQGTIDFDDFYRALKETGYTGDFTLEVPRFMKAFSDQGLTKEATVFAQQLGRKMMENNIKNKF